MKINVGDMFVYFHVQFLDSDDKEMERVFTYVVYTHTPNHPIMFLYMLISYSSVNHFCQMSPCLSLSLPVTLVALFRHLISNIGVSWLMTRSDFCNHEYTYDNVSCILVYMLIRVFEHWLELINHCVILMESYVHLPFKLHILCKNTWNRLNWSCKQ